MQTHQFSILFLLEGDRTVCRFASSSCTTIGGIEEKLMYCTKEKNKQRERKREREREGRVGEGGRKRERLREGGAVRGGREGKREGGEKIERHTCTNSPFFV